MTFLKAVLETRGTLVGHVPEGTGHFGVTSRETLKLDLYGQGDRRLLHAEVGRIAPGQRSSECFMTAEGHDRILLMNANPWSYLQWTPQSPFPPLADTRVLPLALGRHSIARIVVSDPRPGEVEEILRREIPEDRRLPMDKGPRFEWYGVFPGEGEKRLNDSAAFNYVGFVSALTFDEFLGPRSPQHEPPFQKPALAITLHFDGEAKDLIVLGARADKNLHHLLNSSTGQVFLIAADKAARLRPDTKALLEPPPAPREPAPAPRPVPEAK